MPTVDSLVGPLPLPAPAGAPNAEFPEPTTAFLLSYLRFWLKWGLDTKIRSMTQPPVHDAVPVANAYTNSPSATYLTRKLPALFVYWNGKSKNEHYSTVRLMRVRDFAVLYTFEKLIGPEVVSRWSGLVSSVDAIFSRAFDRLAHPAYTIDGSHPAGQDIRDMFSWMGVEYSGGSEGFLQPTPEAAMRELTTAAGRAGANKAQGGIQEGYPSFLGTVRIWEEIGRDQPLDPEDLNHDGTATLAGGEGTGDVEPNLLERILPAPDGTSELEDP